MGNKLNFYETKDAIRSSADSPDMMYYDGWFTRVPVEDLIGKNVYFEPDCFFSGHPTKKEVKDFGINLITKKDFNASRCNYYVAMSGFTKEAKKYFNRNKEKKAAYAQWQKSGRPMVLSISHIYEDWPQK